MASLGLIMRSSNSGYSLIASNTLLTSGMISLSSKTIHAFRLLNEAKRATPNAEPNASISG